MQKEQGLQNGFDGYFRKANSSGRDKGGSAICFENITSELW
jgi:hypothetical protein